MNRNTSAAGLVGLLLVLAFPAAAADSEYRFRLRGRIFSEYTDNLFHYTDARLDQFGTANSPGERFDGIDDTSDVVTRAQLHSEYRWKLDKRRYLELVLRGDWFRHLENDIADYGELRGGGSLDLTKRDHLELVVERTLDRFKKNYRISDSTVFDDASFDQTDVTFGYTRRIGKRKRGLYVGADYDSRRRRYDEPFESRDLDGDYLTLRTEYRLGKRSRAQSSLQLGDVDSGIEIDGGIAIDRSYDQYRLAQEFEFDLRRRVELGLQLDYRRRDYTTDVVADGGRFDRQDDWKRVRIELSKGWKNGLTFRARATVVDNDSDRFDPTIETDEAGYRDTAFGVGVGYTF